MSELTRRKVLAALSFAAAGCCASLAEMQFSSWNASTNSNFLLPAKGRGLFEEVPSTISGINWRHVNGRSQQYYLPETTGAGCAFLDYDNDGWMDIYLVNSGKCDFYDPQPPLRNALYRNNRDVTFTDVTAKAGVAGGGYGTGVAVGDYDVDGFLDLFVGNDTVQNFLFANQGNGKFTEIGVEAGVAYSAEGNPRSGMGVDAADYDGDGWPDLFVSNVDREMYSLYHNNHDQTF